MCRNTFRLDSLLAGEHHHLDRQDEVNQLLQDEEDRRLLLDEEDRRHLHLLDEVGDSQS